MNVFIKQNLILGSVLLLGACAGGGGVSLPDTVIPIPTNRALTPGTTANGITVGPVTSGWSYKGPITTSNSTATPSGKLDYWNTETSYTSSWSGTTTYSATPGFVYQTSDGKVYDLSSYTDPFIKSVYSLTGTVPLDNKHEGQKLDNGSRLLACCELNALYYPATRVRDTRFGIWLSPTGEVDMFVGGVASKPENMQGATASNGYDATGKATYQVWAFRTKNGQFTSSSYDRKNTISKLTVNFNSNKVGGTILGNADFGDSIEFTDVNVNGTKFSGTVTSGSVAGNVDGAFYGSSGNEIGGMIKFNSNATLNTVFGGAVKSSWNDKNANYTGTDTNPIY